MPNAPIHVLGRGIVGLSLAYELVQRGLRPVVVGPASPRLGSASYAAVGVSSLKGNIQPKTPLFTAKLAGHKMLETWLATLERESGHPIPRLFTGIHEPFFSLTGYEAIRERVFHRIFTGCHDVKVLAAKEMQGLFHSLAPFRDEVQGGFAYTHDGWYEPRAALTALEICLRSRGVTFIDTEVESVHEHLDQGLELKTRLGPLRAEEVIVATGIFANELLAASGIKAFDLAAVAGETLEGKAPSGVSGVLNFGKMNLSIFSNSYSFGSTSRVVHGALPVGPDMDGVASLKALLHKTYACTEPSTVRFGIRARYKDQHPAIGPLFLPSGTRRLWIALGFHKNGLQLAPLFAQKLVAWLGGKSPPSSDHAFLTTRF